MAQRVEKLYRRKIWKERWMNYECLLCPYATLNAVKMAGHLKAVHGREMAAGRPLTDAESRPGGADDAAIKPVKKSDDEVTK